MYKEAIYLFLNARNIFFILLIDYLLNSSSLFAQKVKKGFSPTKDLTELSIIQWNTENGLPINTINDIMQSNDGFIWLATYEGFLKFDGIKTVQIRDLKNPTVRPPVGYSFYEDSDENMWFATLGLGVLKYSENKFINIKGTPKSVISIYKDNKNTVWVGSANFGVYKIEDEKLSEVNYKGINDVSINGISEDSSERIWFVTDGKGVTYLNKNQFTTIDSKSGLSSNVALSILIGKNGGVWIGTTNGLNKFQNGKIKSFTRLSGTAIRRLTFDDFGNLWMATNQGLFRLNVKTNKLDQLSIENGLPTRALTGLIFDKEGSLWLSTDRDGLIQLIPSSFKNILDKKILDSDKINIIQEVNTNEFLMGSDNGKVFYYKNEKISIFPITSNLKNQRIRDIKTDNNNYVWICTYAGVLKKKGDEEKLFTIKNGLPTNQARVVYQDSQNNIWIGTRNGGLVKYNENGDLEIINKSDGLGSDFIMSINEDNEGNILVGTVDGGLNIINSNGKIDSYNENDGLPGEVIFNTYVDDNGAIWICTNNGLTKFFNGIFVTIYKSDGLLVDIPFDYLEDEFGFVWIPSTYGVVRVEKKELEDFVDLKIDKVNAELFDKDDGMISKECIGATRSLKSSDGRLWFPTVGGISNIDPQKIPKNLLAPPVRITALKVDNTYINLSKKVNLDPSAQRFLFEFTALSFIAPHKMKIKYKLEGFDRNWIEPKENERYAAYTNLSYGDYTFKVKASNNNGVWNEKGATLDFYISSYYYQKPLFYVLSIIISFLIIWIGVRWRTQMIKNKSKVLQKIVNERTIEIQKQQEEITRQRDDLKVSYENVKRLSDVGKKITTCLSVQSIIETTYENINQLMVANIFAIGIYNQDKQAIKFYGKEKNEDKILTSSDLVSNNRQLSVWCLQNQEEVFINNFKNEMKNFSPVNYHHKKEINSMIYIPLNTKSKNLGVISVQAYKENSYSNYDLNILKNLSVSVSIALENAEVYQNIQLQKEEIEAQSEKLKIANVEITKRNDEIEVAHTLIKNKNDELSHLNSLLEAKVFESTYELRSALKELDLFIYRTAHDLKGPVARLMGLCNIIALEDDKTVINKCVELMKDNSLEMKKLLNILMRTQNIKNKDLQIKEIDISNLLRKIYHSFEEFPAYNKINFQFNPNADSVIRTDVFLIEHLFINLIENSFNFIDHNKDQNYINIEIGLADKNKYRITIKDNGIGISKDVSNKIYDMFYRGTEISKGFGLGLYEVKLIIEKLNGKIWYKRSNTRETEFLIFLPLN